MLENTRQPIKNGYGTKITSCLRIVFYTIEMTLFETKFDTETWKDVGKRYKLRRFISVLSIVTVRGGIV